MFVSMYVCERVTPLLAKKSKAKWAGQLLAVTTHVTMSTFTITSVKYLILWIFCKHLLIFYGIFYCHLFLWFHILSF